MKTKPSSRRFPNCPAAWQIRPGFTPAYARLVMLCAAGEFHWLTGLPSKRFQAASIAFARFHAQRGLAILFTDNFFNIWCAHRLYENPVGSMPISSRIALSPCCWITRLIANGFRAQNCVAASRHIKVRRKWHELTC
jgi:hypothetical protein